MVNYKLVLAYDGTNYAGWQSQPNRDTIQSRVETALWKLFGEPISVHGAGRTDAGVHARQQVASFKASKGVDRRTLVRALNGNLPDDIRALNAAMVPSDFHARFSAKRKEYRYQIWCRAVMNPFQQRYALHHPRKLDLTAMRRVAKLFVGRRDFAALAANPQREVKSTIRKVLCVKITGKEGLVTITVQADGFLYKMVRSIVGALLKTGRNETGVEEVRRYLAERKRTHFISTAPAHGLFLWRVWY